MEDERTSGKSPLPMVLAHNRESKIKCLLRKERFLEDGNVHVPDGARAYGSLQ